MRKEKREVGLLILESQEGLEWEKNELLMTGDPKTRRSYVRAVKTCANNYEKRVDQARQRKSLPSSRR